MPASVKEAPSMDVSGGHDWIRLEQESDARRRLKNTFFLFLFIQPLALVIFIMNAGVASLGASFFASTWMVLMALQADRALEGASTKPAHIEADGECVRFTDDNGHVATYAWRDLVGHSPMAKSENLDGVRDINYNFLNDGWCFFRVTKANDAKLMEIYRRSMGKDPPPWDELYFAEKGLELDSSAAVEHFRIQKKQFRKGMAALLVALFGSIAIIALGPWVLDALGPAFVLGADALVILAVLISIVRLLRQWTAHDQRQRL